jgi:hypothetical protein
MARTVTGGGPRANPTTHDLWTVRATVGNRPDHQVDLVKGRRVERVCRSYLSGLATTASQTGTFRQYLAADRVAGGVG